MSKIVPILLGLAVVAVVASTHQTSTKDLRSKADGMLKDPTKSSASAMESLASDLEKRIDEDPKEAEAVASTVLALRTSAAAKRAGGSGFLPPPPPPPGLVVEQPPPPVATPDIGSTIAQGDTVYVMSDPIYPDGNVPGVPVHPEALYVSVDSADDQNLKGRVRGFRYGGLDYMVEVITPPTLPFSRKLVLAKIPAGTSFVAPALTLEGDTVYVLASDLYPNGNVPGTPVPPVFLWIAVDTASPRDLQGRIIGFRYHDLDYKTEAPASTLPFSRTIVRARLTSGTPFAAPAFSSAVTTPPTSPATSRVIGDSVALGDTVLASASSVYGSNAAIPFLGSAVDRAQVQGLRIVVSEVSPSNAALRGTVDAVRLNDGRVMELREPFQSVFFLRHAVDQILKRSAGNLSRPV